MAKRGQESHKQNRDQQEATRESLAAVLLPLLQREPEATLAVAERLLPRLLQELQTDDKQIIRPASETWFRLLGLWSEHGRSPADVATLVTILIAFLEDSSPIRRELATVLLPRCGNHALSAVKALRRCLKNELQPSVRERAASAIDIIEKRTDDQARRSRSTDDTLTLSADASTLVSSHSAISIPATPHENRPSESLAEVVNEIDALRDHVRAQLPLWVSAIVGRSFEDAEEAKRTVEAISNLARFCGFRILYEGQPVSMCVSVGSRQRSPTIALFRGREYVQTEVPDKRLVPPVTVGPVS